MSDGDIAFYATMTISGRPVTVSSGRICTRRSNGKPVEFGFHWSGDNFFITAGELEGRQYIGLDGKGFLCIKDRAEVFSLLDASRNERFSRSYNLLHRVEVCMFATDRSAVIQFEHDRPHDVTQIYNYLMTARKVKHEDVNGDYVYLVPAGNEGWVEYPADKPYSATPVQITLDIK